MDDDILIIQSVLKGDTEKFSILVNRYKNLVYSICYRFFNNRAQAEDLAHETFLKAYKNLSKYKITYDFKSWICTICINHCRDFKRKKTIMLQEMSDGIIDQQASGTDMSSNNPYKDKIEILNRCVSRLPSKYREVIVLRFYEDCSYEEIAQITKKPIGTVKTYLFRGQKILRNLFEAELKNAK